MRFALVLVLLVGCGAEKKNGVPVASGSAGAMDGGGQAAGGATGTAGAGDGPAAGGVSGAGGGAGSASCDPVWPCSPMPNPASAKLPHPAAYSAADGVVVDQVTGLQWQQAAPADKLAAAAADAYCAELTLSGYDDWRLPTRIELVSLVDFTRSPAIDSEQFPDVSGNFWTSSRTAKVSNPQRYWQVSFTNGGTLTSSEAVGSRVRCVRSEIAAEGPVARYLFEGQSPNEVVTDAATGLSWQRTLDSKQYSFAEAEAYCSELSVAGGGFRVPSMKELQTLVDERKNEPPAIDATAFPATPAMGFWWTSSKSVNDAGAAWFVNFASGEASDYTTTLGDIVDMPLNVRCVR